MEHRSRHERNRERLLDELCGYLGPGVRDMLSPCSPDTLRSLRDFYLKEKERTKTWARSDKLRPDSSGLEKKYTDEEEERVVSLALDPELRSALGPLIDALNSDRPDRAMAQGALDQLAGQPLTIDHLFILASESRLRGIGHMVGGRSASNRGTSLRKLCMIGQRETQIREEYAASGKRPKQKEIARRIYEEEKRLGLEYDTILKYLGPKYAEDRYSPACREILESRD